MSVSELFVGLLTNALKTEESELAQLCSNCSLPSLVSIRQYDEGWIKLLLAKAVMQGNRLRVQFEKKRIDICLYEQNRCCGYVEMKGPYEAKQNFHPVLFQRIIEDFRKQGERSRTGAEFLVVVFVHGGQDNVEGWISSRLLRSVGKELPHLHVERLRTEPIPLNGKAATPNVLCVAAFRVTKLP